MIEIGRMCVKIAGRDARGKCVIVDVIDERNVLIDGQVRRKKCNVKHVLPLKDVVKIKKNASHADIVKEFKKLGIEIKEKKAKKIALRPKKQRKKKEKILEEEKKPGEKEAPKEKIKKVEKSKPKLSKAIEKTPKKPKQK